MNIYTISYYTFSSTHIKFVTICLYVVQSAFFCSSCFLFIPFLQILAQSCVDSSLRSGRCVYMFSCPQLIQDYYEAAKFSPNLPDFQTFVSGSMCGFDGNNFMVSTQLLINIFHIQIKIRKYMFFFIKLLLIIFLAY